MNAKKVEELTGISKRNLRFYEDRELIHPGRNPENDYREYSDEDVETLKLIRTLRMLDVLLTDVKRCIDGAVSLTELSVIQEQRLQNQKRKIETALKFCHRLGTVSVDRLLESMDRPENRKHLFREWKRDFARVDHSEHLKYFSFSAENGIADERDFTDELCRYGREKDLNLVITKEGMCPEFRIDGVEYTAHREYRYMASVPMPVEVVMCEAVHPELLEPEIPGFRKKVLKFIRNWWFLLLFIIPEIVVSIRNGETLPYILLAIAFETALVAGLSYGWRNYQG